MIFWKGWGDCKSLPAPRQWDNLYMIAKVLLVEKHLTSPGKDGRQETSAFSIPPPPSQRAVLFSRI